jgi:hypothetical protein
MVKAQLAICAFGRAFSLMNGGREAATDLFEG